MRTPSPPPNVSCWNLCTCFPRRSRRCGGEARVRHALGGEGLHSGVSGTLGRGAWQSECIRADAEPLLDQVSSEGGAPGRGELRQSQRHRCTCRDTIAELPAGGARRGGKKSCFTLQCRKYLRIMVEDLIHFLISKWKHRNHYMITLNFKLVSCFFPARTLRKQASTH